jgi:hypothetical protein
MKKNKKHHDETTYDSHEGFREGVRKYHYIFEHKGYTVASSYSNFNYAQKEGDYFNHSSGYYSIRRIQQTWMYGTLYVLVQLDK